MVVDCGSSSAVIKELQNKPAKKPILRVCDDVFCIVWHTWKSARMFAINADIVRSVVDPNLQSSAHDLYQIWH